MLAMTNEEILRDYRTAKNKGKQVGILAELNACKRDEIIRVLKEMGVSIKELPRAPRKNKAGTEEQGAGVLENCNKILRNAKEAEAEREDIREEKKMRDVEDAVIDKLETAEAEKKNGNGFYDMVARMWSAYLSGITGTETVITAENVRVMNGVAVLMKK